MKLIPSFKTMAEKKILLGNEAIAEGAMEAGVKVACAYPGTPSTEVLEYLAEHSKDGVHTQWSVNEKVALETVSGASYSGVRSMAVMKHVGLNVALDPFMTLAYTGVNGGLVVVVADDPGMHSSQNRQDTRHLVRAAKLLGLSPSDSREAKEMTRDAFKISEELKLPVLLHSMTSVSHTSSPVEVGEHKEPGRGEFRKDFERYVMVPQNARKRHPWLIEKQKEIRDFVEETGYNELFMEGDGDKAVVACGSTYKLAQEFKQDHALLKCGTWPVPQEKLKRLLENAGEVVVLEEGDPIVEEQVRCMHENVVGRLSGDLPFSGELPPKRVREILGGEKTRLRKVDENLVKPRPPVMCPGCPHRGTFYVMKEMGVEASPGDIGCYALGFQKPFEMLDTCLCMGASIGQAAGINHSGVDDVYALIGDSTFMHSGITGLVNSVYNQADVTLVILDNHDVAMTGHQPTPLTGVKADGEKGGKVGLEELCRACGADYVKRYDPMDLQETRRVFKKAREKEGVKVLIADSPCIQINKEDIGESHFIDEGKCTSCGACLKLGCPAIYREDGKVRIDDNLCAGCTLCIQVCPRDAVREK